MQTPHRLQALLSCGIALAATFGMAKAQVADGILIDAGYVGQSFAAASPVIEYFPWRGVVTFLAVLSVLIGLPVLLLVFGIKKHRRFPSVGAKLMVGTGTTICLAYLIAIVAYVVAVGPYRSGILTQGKSPGGAEYCVVQTYKGFFEPYQVSFYVRDAEGIWRFNYLEHQGNDWKSAGVSFSDGSAKVTRNGVHFADIELPSDVVDLATVLPGYRARYPAADLSIEDVFSFHNQKYGSAQTKP